MTAEVTKPATALPPGARALLATPSYLRLWFAGACGNAMRWLELLVAGIFAYTLTGSAFWVAVVTVSRTLPLLFVGALAGVVGEAVNRTVIVLSGLLIMAANSAVLCLLAGSGLIQLWHVALGGAVAGTVWATEMAVRRRMVGEVVEPGLIGPAIALDSLTNSAMRMVGPLIGGATFQTIGLGGAYLLSTMLYLVAALVIVGLEFRQEPRRLNFSRIPAEIAEGLAIVRHHPVLLGVVLITIITNTFGFSYSALIAPLGLHEYGLPPVLVGVLAGAEPLGAITAGFAIASGSLRME